MMLSQVNQANHKRFEQVNDEQYSEIKKVK